MPAPAPTEVQTSWEDAAEESVAVAELCAASTASTAKVPLPGNDSCHGDAPHDGSSDAKAGAAEAWAAAGPEDDAQAAQGEVEFDANMLWCASGTHSDGNVYRAQHSVVTGSLRMRVPDRECVRVPC